MTTATVSAYNRQADLIADQYERTQAANNVEGMISSITSGLDKLAEIVGKVSGLGAKAMRGLQDRIRKGNNRILAIAEAKRRARQTAEEAIDNVTADEILADGLNRDGDSKMSGTSPPGLRNIVNQGKLHAGALINGLFGKKTPGFNADGMQFNVVPALSGMSLLSTQSPLLGGNSLGGMMMGSFMDGFHGDKAKDWRENKAETERRRAAEVQAEKDSVKQREDRSTGSEWFADRILGLVGGLASGITGMLGGPLKTAAIFSAKLMADMMLLGPLSLMGRFGKLMWNTTRWLALTSMGKSTAGVFKRGRSARSKGFGKTGKILAASALGYLGYKAYQQKDKLTDGIDTFKSYFDTNGYSDTNGLTLPDDSSEMLGVTEEDPLVNDIYEDNVTPGGTGFDLMDVLTYGSLAAGGYGMYKNRKGGPSTGGPSTRPGDYNRNGRHSRNTTGRIDDVRRRSGPGMNRSNPSAKKLPGILKALPWILSLAGGAGLSSMGSEEGEGIDVIDTLLNALFIKEGVSFGAKAFNYGKGKLFPGASVGAGAASTASTAASGVGAASGAGKAANLLKKGAKGVKGHPLLTLATIPLLWGDALGTGEREDVPTLTSKSVQEDPWSFTNALLYPFRKLNEFNMSAGGVSVNPFDYFETDWNPIADVESVGTNALAKGSFAAYDFLKEDVFKPVFGIETLQQKKEKDAEGDYLATAITTKEDSQRHVGKTGQQGWFVGSGVRTSRFYPAYDWMTDMKLSFQKDLPGRILQLRFYSYGIGRDNRAGFARIAHLEEVVGRYMHRNLQTGEVEFNTPDRAGSEEIAAILSADRNDKAFMDPVIDWFLNRFVVEYGNFLTALWDLDITLKPGLIGNLPKGKLAELAMTFRPDPSLDKFVALPFTASPISSVTKREIIILIDLLEFSAKPILSAESKLLGDDSKQLELERKSKEFGEKSEEQAKEKREEKLSGAMGISGATGALTDLVKPKAAIDLSLGDVFSSAFGNTPGFGGDILDHTGPLTSPNGGFSLGMGDDSPLMGDYSNVSIDDAMRIASEKSGIPEEILWTTAKQESGLNPKARNPGAGQTAGGLFQFTDETWKGMIAKHGKKYGIPEGADKFNPMYNALMGALYMKDHLPYIEGHEELGIDMMTALYMGNFMGSGGVRSLFNAYRKNPNMSMEEWADPKAYAANKIMHGKSIGGFIQYYMNLLNRKMQEDPNIYAAYRANKASAESKHSDGPKYLNRGAGSVNMDTVSDKRAAFGQSGADFEFDGNHYKDAETMVAANNLRATGGIGFALGTASYADSQRQQTGIQSTDDYRGKSEILGVEYSKGQGPDSVSVHPIKAGFPFYFTSLFGPRNTGIAGASTTHGGVDIGTPTRRPGVPIVATGAGKVWRSYSSSTYGEVVYLTHPDGMQTRYAHLDRRFAKEGQEVEAGEVIGTMGNTGIGSGVHLHFETRKGHAQDSPKIDPFNFPVIRDSYKGHRVTTTIDEGGKVESDETEDTNTNADNIASPSDFVEETTGNDSKPTAGAMFGGSFMDGIGNTSGLDDKSSAGGETESHSTPVGVGASAGMEDEIRRSNAGDEKELNNKTEVSVNVETDKMEANQARQVDLLERMLEALSNLGVDISTGINSQLSSQSQQTMPAMGAGQKVGLQKPSPNGIDVRHPK